VSAVDTAPPPDWLRHAVRGVLEQSPGYHRLQPADRRALAQAMVKVSSIAAALIGEELAADAQIRPADATALERPAPRRPPLARAQDAPGFGAAADRIADTTRNVLNAVSFPRFVTDLINGVFKSMLDSSAQQMQLYVKLLNDVSASAEGFERSQFSIAGIRQWVADHFPDQIEYDMPQTEPGDPPPDPEELANITLRLKPNASMPSTEELRAVLGLGPQESIEASNPEQLVPLARRAIARQRQQMLATMVMLGMQRIVIDSGRISASMHFHIDTRSAATEDRGSKFGMQNRVKAAGSFGYGPWGASAEVENTISYVSTQRSQNTEEIKTDLDLNSSVELVFKTDYLPLERLAGGPQIERIKVNTLNPEAELKTLTDARTASDKASRDAEAKRSEAITKELTPQLPAAKPGEPGSIAAADIGRAEAKKDKPQQDRRQGQGQPQQQTLRQGQGQPQPQPQPQGSMAPVKAAALEEETAARKPDVVFAPTPPESVEALLALASPQRGETLVDLGCGDGRVLVAAARHYGCRGVGYDLDPQRIEEARANITAAGVGDRVRVEQRDLFTVDLSGADIVTLYLLPQLNVELIPQLQALRPGARVVSHDFAVSGAIPDRVVQDYLPRLNMFKTYFLFTAPLRLQPALGRHEWVESARMPWEAAAASANDRAAIAHAPR
jgi:predicted O-methyltransferase YrrM